MQQVWKVILDDDFKEAYEHGFVVECLDGISQQFYPRIFTYSADYPEKCIWNVHHVAKYWFYHLTGFFWQVFETRASVLLSLPSMLCAEVRHLQTRASNWLHISSQEGSHIYWRHYTWCPWLHIQTWLWYFQHSGGAHIEARVMDSNFGEILQ